MKNFNKKKPTNKLPVPDKVKKGFRFYCTAVLSLALILGCSMTAFAAVMMAAFLIIGKKKGIPAGEDSSKERPAA